MIKKYSIRQRILKTVGEIAFGTITIVLVIIGLSYILAMMGQVSFLGDNAKLSINKSITQEEIIRQMDQLTCDYILFDKNQEKIVGKYNEDDFRNYQEVLKNKEPKTINYSLYENYESDKFTLIVRKSTIPEFVNPSFRSISYNMFTYFLFLILELFLIIFVVFKLIREFSINFRKIRKISLNMGKILPQNEESYSRIIEFDDILIMLYQKSEELATLIEVERGEKRDLSFQVAALSHDLKTPLTVLKGNIELLEMTKLSKEQMDFIESIKKSINAFEKYFNSMLSYTRLLIDEKDYFKKVILDEFLDELLLDVQDIMRVHSVNFQIENEAYSIDFRVNQLSLSRALINILLNAAQHTATGENVLFIIREDVEYLSFIVWNNGNPFSDESLKNASKLFFTEDDSRSGKHYGIGLSFAKGVALRHRGNLILTNPLQGGAKVILKIKK
ncbi:MAG: sensor histidine kinase [Culicoidibacterales bacterium]